MWNPFKSETVKDVLKFTGLSMIPNYITTFSALYLFFPELSLAAIVGISFTSVAVPSASYTGYKLYRYRKEQQNLAHENLEQEKSEEEEEEEEEGEEEQKDQQLSLQNQTQTVSYKVRRGTVTFASVLTAVLSKEFSQVIATLIANKFITTEDPDKAQEQLQLYYWGVAVPIALICTILTNKAYGPKGQPWYSPASDVLATSRDLLLLLYYPVQKCYQCCQAHKNPETEPLLIVNEENQKGILEKCFTNFKDLWQRCCTRPCEAVEDINTLEKDSENEIKVIPN